MAITISKDRPVPLPAGNVLKNDMSLFAIISRMTPGESFFVPDEGGDYTRNTVVTHASIARKKCGLNLTVRHMTEKGVLGTGVFCLTGAPPHLVRAQA